jgi:hypothetical protein
MAAIKGEPTSGPVAEIPQGFSGSEDDLLQFIPVLQIQSQMKLDIKN